MISHLRELLRYRELLWMWTVRDIKVRYKQTLLGAAWAILQPLSMMVVFSLIFTYFVRMPTDGIPYPAFSYTALLPWTFLATSVSFGVPSVVTNMNLVTKVYFPREIFPIAAVAASFVDFLVASVVYIGMMLVFRVGLKATMLLIPLLLVVQIALTLGVVLLAAAVNVRYRDVRFIVPLAVQLWMYATPIIYPVSLVPERWQPLYVLNPMAGLIEGYRAAVLRGQWPDPVTLGVATLISAGVFLLGYRVFKAMEVGFADII